MVVVQDLWFFVYFLVDVMVVVFFYYVVVVVVCVVGDGVVDIVQVCVGVYCSDVFLYCLVGGLYQFVCGVVDFIDQVGGVGVGDVVVFFQGDVEVDDLVIVQYVGGVGYVVVDYVVD